MDWQSSWAEVRKSALLWVKTTNSVSLNSEKLFTHGALQRASQYAAVTACGCSLFNFRALCSDTLDHLLPYGSITFVQNCCWEYCMDVIILIYLMLISAQSWVSLNVNIIRIAGGNRTISSSATHSLTVCLQVKHLISPCYSFPSSKIQTDTEFIKKKKIEIQRL